MNESALRQLLVRHNFRSRLLAIGLGVSSVALWYLSYTIATRLTAGVFRYWLPPQVPNWLEPIVVMVCMILLVIEMWRSRGNLFDLTVLHDWGFYSDLEDLDLPIFAAIYPRFQINSGQATVWLILQTVLMAPHSTVLALRHWRSRVVIDEQELNRSVELYHQLAKAKDWVPITSKLQRSRLTYLKRAGLLWMRREGRLLEVQTFRFEAAPPWWSKRSSKKQK